MSESDETPEMLKLRARTVHSQSIHLAGECDRLRAALKQAEEALLDVAEWQYYDGRPSCWCVEDDGDHGEACRKARAALSALRSLGVGGMSHLAFDEYGPNCGCLCRCLAHKEVEHLERESEKLLAALRAAHGALKKLHKHGMSADWMLTRKEYLMLREAKEALALTSPPVASEATSGDAGKEKLYPCDGCGVMRTKAQGGTVFTVCDACWDKACAKPASGDAKEGE
jgi:hypothetical protein